MRQRLLLSLLACTLFVACGDEPASNNSQDNNKPAPNNKTNLPPVVEAGENRVVKVGELVEISASESSDPEGAELTVMWTMVVPAGSQAKLNNADRFRANFTPDVEGDYVFTVVVSDGELTASDRVTIRASGMVAPNSAPVAKAGEDKTIPLGLTVSLDGSASSDADGDRLTYLWSIVSAPPESMAALITPMSISATIKPDKAGAYVFGLVVNDGKEASAQDTMTLTVLPETMNNSRPVADAGADRVVGVGDEVTLDGGASSDADADPLTYEWTLIELPAGSTAALDDATSQTPKFTADLKGMYVFELVVNDSFEDSLADRIVINATDGSNQPPVADAGPDFTSRQGRPITLDASRSSDPDMDRLTYRWTLVSKPSGSLIFLQNATSPNASLTPDRLGPYVLELTVNDGQFEAKDQLTITVVDGSTTCLIISEYIEGSGNNKAIELYNCGGLMLDMTKIGLCTIQNDNTTCSSTSLLSGLLQPSTTYGICHTTFASGAPAGSCNFTSNGLMSFNGDDRLILFEDTDGDGAFSGQDFVLDAFGQASSKPASQPWENVTYRRCNFSPYDGMSSFDASAYFNTGTFDDFTEFGRPPVMGCGQANQAPTAVAQVASMGAVGQTLTLDGTSSSDPEGDALTYRWRIVTAPTNSLAMIAAPTSISATLTPDLEGQYVIELVVNDGRQDSLPVTKTVTVTAAARPSACLIISEYIEGSASNKAIEIFNCGSKDVDLSGFGLCIVSNTNTTCSGGIIMTGTVQPGQVVGICNGGLNMSLVDPGDCDIAAPSVTSFSGDDRLILYEDKNMDGTFSSADIVLDAFGESAVKPAGEPWVDKSYRRCDFKSYLGQSAFDVSLTYSASANIDDFSDFGVAPTVTCRQGANRAPVADAGMDQVLVMATGLNLDGSKSYDLDNDPLTFQWAIVQKPAMSAATLNSTSVTTMFTPDVDGTYLLSLTVSDGQLMHTDQLSVRVGTNLPARCLIISEYIEGSSNNKALELYNCGSQPIDLSKVGICNYSNASTTCFRTSMLTGAGMLAPDAVFGACNGGLNMGLVTNPGACSAVVPAVEHNGDDRLLVFTDTDASGGYNMGDEIMDAFGQLTVRPNGTPWADKTFRRCNWTPFDGAGAFDLMLYYSTHGVDDFSDFGIKPSAMSCP